MNIANVKNFGIFEKNNYSPYKPTKIRTVKYFEFEYHIKSKGKIFLDGKTYEMHDNILIIKKPNQQVNSCASFKCIFFYLELPDNSEYYKFIYDIPNIYQMINFTSYNSIFQSIFKHLTIAGIENDDYINAKLLELFYYLKKDSQKNKDSSSISLYKFNDIILKSAKYIKENLSDQLTLEKLSSNLGYSKNYFQHVFKTVMGITPQKYLLNARINQAKYLLSGTNYSLLEISEKCGFDSQAYFSHVFKQVTNYTPKEFRNMSLLRYAEK